MYYLLKTKYPINFHDLANYLESVLEKEFIFEKIDENLFYILSSNNLREDLFTIKDLLSSDICPIKILASPYLDEKIIIFLKEIDIYTTLNYIPLADLLLKRLLKGCLFTKDYLDNLFKEVDDEELKTILFFINNGSNVLSSAKLLYLHRNTLNYRIQKFVDKTGLDLRNPEIEKLLYLYSVTRN